MSAPSEQGTRPPVPGVWRLGWLLFMQPLKLHKLISSWGLESHPSLLELRYRMLVEDRTLRQLFARLGLWLFVIGPCAAAGISLLLAGIGVPVGWQRVAGGVALGVALGVAFGVASGVAFGVGRGVALGVAGGVALGVAYGVAAGVAVGVPGSVALCVARGVGRGVVSGVVEGVALGVAYGVALGVPYGVAYGVGRGVAYGVAFGVAFGIGFFCVVFRLPTYVVEAPLQWLLCRLPFRGERAIARLPFRHHDLIYLPLPGLVRFLVDLRDDPDTAQQLIAEAAASVGQKGPARKALVELQAITLEEVASGRSFVSVAEQQLPFLPTPGEEHPAFKTFVDAAGDLGLARSTGSHAARRRALQRADNRLAGFENRIAGERRPDLLSRRLLVTAGRWRQVVADERAGVRQSAPAKPKESQGD